MKQTDADENSVVRFGIDLWPQLKDDLSDFAKTIVLWNGQANLKFTWLPNLATLAIQIGLMLSQAKLKVSEKHEAPND